MSHLDIIIITGTLFISSTLGVYAALRYINHHTNPAMNTLTRRGDIELQYIEPSSNNNLDLLQPSTNNTLDLVQPQQVYTLNSNSCLEDSINLQSIPSFLNQSNINCCLENSININLYFI
jgi:hypothetical protein